MTPDDRPSAGDKLRYQVDRFLSWGPLARVLGLFGVSFVLVVFWALFARLAVTPPEGEGFDLFEALWWAMTRVADAGTMGGDQGTLVRVIATLSTLSGICVVALLFGLMSTTVGEKIDDLRKGKSPVIDEGHTLVLGFGEKVFAILHELREANSNQKHAAVVILSTEDKEAVENQVKERMGDMGVTRVVVRQGLPWAVDDLKKVGAGRARSIIILAGQATPGEDSGTGAEDMAAIKTLLALRRVPGALTRNHAVVELVDPSRRSVVDQLGAGGVEVVAMEETLSRMMVQTVRQSGLAQVYRDLLTYEGSELYFKTFQELAGLPFGEAQWRMKDAVVVGVRRPAAHGPGLLLLNPKDDFLLELGDELLVLAEDDDSFSLTARHQPQVPASFRPPAGLPRASERLLICGMSQKLADMLREYDNYVLPGSEVWLMPGLPKEEFQRFIQQRVGPLQKLKLKHVDGDPTLPEDLGRVAEAGAFQCAMVVATEGLSTEEADARTVITVLLLREVYRKLGGEAPRLISEILDPRTKDLVERDYGADFVVSSEMTSMLLAQVSERRELNAVFQDLFDSDGNEVYLKRAECYAPLGEPTGWLAVQWVARSRQEVALGYLRPGQGPVLNPRQDEVLTFAAGDRVVVVSEDDRESVEPKEAAAAGEDAPPAHDTPPPDLVPDSAPQPSAPTQPAVPAISTGGTRSAALPRLAPPPGTRIPQPRAEPVRPPSAQERSTTAGPRTPGPSNLPRGPLPGKPKG